MRPPAPALLAYALAAAVLAVWPAPAAQAQATAQDVRQLAARAGSEPAALEELRRIDTVDGRPVDLDTALEADGAELAERLETLAEGGSTAPPEPAAARRDAAGILDERRFREPETPRPFRGPLAWLGDRLEELYEWLADRLPGGGGTLWTLLAGLVVLAAALASLALGRRRGGRSVAGAGSRQARRRGADPGDLERRADEAERRGDLEAALRLRFRAGLLRLERAKAIPARESLTSGEIARRLRSADFELLAGTFDEVVYGGRAPAPADVHSARAGWTRVLEEVRGR